MAAGANGSEPRFRVSFLAAARAAYLDIIQEAGDAGVEEVVKDAVRDLIDRLIVAPREFGEPMYHLRGMSMTVRTGSVRPLFVEYGVHDDRPVVVIRRVVWLAG